MTGLLAAYHALVATGELKPDQDQANAAAKLDDIQQQLEAVTIAVERVWVQGSLSGQVVGEEAVQGAAQGRCVQAAHATPPEFSRFPKRCWNRSLAAARNSGVSRR